MFTSLMWRAEPVLEAVVAFKLTLRVVAIRGHSVCLLKYLYSSRYAVMRGIRGSVYLEGTRVGKVDCSWSMMRSACPQDCFQPSKSVDVVVDW